MTREEQQMSNNQKAATVGRGVRAIGCTVLVGAAVLGLAAPAAQAKVIEKSTYLITPEESTRTDSCGLETSDPNDDFPITYSSVGVGTYMLKQRGGDLFFESQRQQTTQTVTALGSTWTAVADVRFKTPLQFLSVEGTKETWRGMNNQHIVVYDPDGVEDYRFDVHSAFIVTIDYGTDPETFTIVDFRQVGHTPGERNACTDALQYANL
jgi:hypothetical protein